MRARLQTLILASVLAFLVGSPGSAQRLAVEKRGMAAKSAFQVDGFDQINLFSGARTGTITLGSAYPVSPQLSYGFTLFNNANGWDHDLVTCNPGGAFDLPVQNEDDNAGFAWRLHLGKVTPSTHRWRYTAPDGSERGFYDELHPGSGSEEGVYYSNDSSYLRLRYTEIGSGPCETPSQGTSECVQIDFPSGNVHEFRNFGNRQDPDFRVTRMKDAFGNKVDVTYPADLVTWKISDDHGREHFVRFAGPAGLYERVSEVDLEAFGGARAVYSFQYTNTAIDRQGFNPDLCGSESERVTVPLLTRLVLPDGAFYDFTYYQTDNLATDVLSGGMKSARLPTGGEIRWSYDRIIIPSQDPDGRFEKYRSTAYAVDRREMALAAGGPAHGTWTYDYRRSLEQVPGDDVVPCHRATTVTDPEGNETVHYFATSNALHRELYGLPFTHCAPDTGYSATGPFLSMEIYEGNASTGTQLRSIYVEYESDGIQAGGGDDNQEKNHRLTYRKTVYHDDGGRFKDVRFSDFDGLGNHRVETRGGNFSSQDAKTVTVDFNGPLGSAFTLPASSDPWVLGTWTQRQVSAAGATAITEACFDGETGFLERTRTLAGASRSSVDVLSVFVEETVGGQGTGRVAQELLYGGDDIPYALDSTYPNLCSMTLPFSGQPPRYRTDHEYAHGVLSKSTAMDACDGSALVTTTDVDVDASTGLVERSRDSAGVYTDFVYDLRGRLVAERSQESAWTTFDYQLPTTTSPGLQPRLTVQDCANGQAACSAAAALTWQRLEYDGLGRQVTERVRYPATSGIVEKARVTAYNALGWKLSQSVWGDTTKKTVFQDHDPFGRPGKITPPGQPSTWLSYQGERVKTRETRVMLEGAGSPQPVFTTQIYDARGRLIEVCEDRRSAWAGNCSDGLLTSYRYDVGDRLERVCSNDVNGTCGQLRRFLYDNRGFLTQERHPEIGPSGNGWTFYSYECGKKPLFYMKGAVLRDTFT